MPDLVERIIHWHAPIGKPALILAGGGSAADLVRIAYAAGQIDHEQAHWQAIDAMTFQSRLLSRRIAGRINSLCTSSLRSGHELESALSNACRRVCEGISLVFDPAPTLYADAGRTLPIGWHVSSDSIAAWVAHCAGISELYLLKSVGPAETSDIADAVHCGWVDPYLSHESKGLKVTMVNLRAIRFASNL